jgi:hypothetical protein
MKSLVIFTLLATHHAYVAADRYGIREATEETGQFPWWGWMALFFGAIVYSIWQHREHREVQKSTYDSANTAVREAKKNEVRLEAQIARLERERASAWEELGLLRNAFFENMNELPTDSHVRKAVESHFSKYPHVASKAK